MYLPTLVSAILALSTTSLAAALEPRKASSCSLKTTKVGVPAATLSGPFLLQASSTSTAVNGRYGALTVRVIPQSITGQQKGLVITFDSEPESEAQPFYLMGTQLVYMNGTQIQPAYSPVEQSRDLNYILVGPAPIETVTDISCTLQKSTCDLICTLTEGTAVATNQCLASPKNQADWRISTNTKHNDCGTPFIPVVIPQ